MPCSALLGYHEGEMYACGPVTTSRVGVSASICFQWALARAMWAITVSPSQRTGSSVASG